MTHISNFVSYDGFCRTNENGLFKENVFKNVYSELVTEFNSNLTLINDIVLSAKFKTHSHHLRDIVMK